MLSRLGLSFLSNPFKSVTVWPNFSPRPFSAPEIAASVWLSLTGSIALSTEVSCWKTVLISTVTC